MFGAGRRCSECFVRCAFRETDTAAERRIRRFLIPFYVVCFVFVTFAMVQRLGDETSLGLFARCWGSALCVTAFVCLVCTSVSPTSSAEFFVPAMLLGIAADHWFAIANWDTPKWTLSVIMFDCLILSDARLPLQGLCLVLSMAWMLALTIDQSTGALGLMTVAERVGGVQPDICDCADPPCARQLLGGLGAANMNCMILAIDFFLTRRFHRGELVARTELSDALACSAEMAKYLADLELEKAEDLLARMTPTDFSEHYSLIISHLRVFAAFLPDALAPATRTTSSGDLTEDDDGPPGLGQGNRSSSLILTDFTAVASSMGTTPESSPLTQRRTRPPRRLGLQPVTRAVACFHLRHAASSDDQSAAFCKKTTLVVSLWLQHLFDAVGRNNGVILRFDIGVCLTSFPTSVPAATAAAHAVTSGNYKLHSAVRDKSTFASAAVAAGPCVAGAVGTAHRRVLTISGTPVALAERAAQIGDAHSSLRVSEGVVGGLTSEGSENVQPTWCDCKEAPLRVRRRKAHDGMAADVSLPAITANPLANPSDTVAAPG